MNDVSQFSFLQRFGGPIALLATASPFWLWVLVVETTHVNTSGDAGMITLLTWAIYRFMVPVVGTGAILIAIIAAIRRPGRWRLLSAQVACEGLILAAWHWSINGRISGL